MKKFFILLTACTMGLIGGAEAMAADNASMNDISYNQRPTYDETVELIDTFIAVVIFDSENAGPMLDKVDAAIASLEGIDQVNAVAYLYIEMHDIIPECGFSQERREEMDQQMAYYLQELFLGDADATIEAFIEWRDSLPDDEAFYASVAFPEYINMIESLACEE